MISPHYCVAEYERAHQRVVEANAEWRKGNPVLLTRESTESEPESNRSPLTELSEWGDWWYCRLAGSIAPETPKELLGRVQRILELCTGSQREQLISLYVGEGEGSREARRRVDKGQNRKPWQLPPLTTYEKAYLAAAKTLEFR